MPTPTEASSIRLLNALAELPRDEMGGSEADGKKLQQLTGLNPAELNDAAALLVHAGYAEWRKYLGTAPYMFGSLSITPRGRYEHERTTAAAKNTPEPSSGGVRGVLNRVIVPPNPIGSPYGFTDEDWEYIADRKDRAKELRVVLGYQFNSPHYDSSKLQTNVRDMFSVAVETYNKLPGAFSVSLEFRPLAAGYGEHLFNEIARDIIASDIAVFETSDLNPNVMVELGVALTWGIRVLPIKHEGTEKPPSDISGQTWADYTDNAFGFSDPQHNDKLVRMVERAVRKKGGGAG